MIRQHKTRLGPASRSSPALLLGLLCLLLPLRSAADSFGPLTPITVSVGTADKPQSKVWSHANTWWAVAPTASVSPSGMWIWRLEPNQSWTPVLHISSSTTASADAKPDGAVTHILVHDNSPELVSVEYVALSNDYQPWTTRPTTTAISLGPGDFESSTIDIDSTGRMWLATEAGNVVRVHYSDSPFSVFSGAINLGTSNADDVAVVTALPNDTIGVLWSDQDSQRFGFRIHEDGADPNVWLADEVPASQSALLVGGGMADDSLNVAVASDGTLYAVVKTSYDTSGFPKIALLVRNLVGGGPGGVWEDLHNVSTSGSRGIVLLNEGSAKLKVVYEAGAGIAQRESDLSPISFGSKQTIIAGESFSDPTSTKQNWSDEVVVLASDGSSTPGVRIALDVLCTGSGDCDDSNECTDNVCNAGSCEYPAVANGTSCDDGLSCTASDECSGGICEGVDDCPMGQSCSAGSDMCEINAPPNGTIDTPTGPLTIVRGLPLDFTGSGSDPEGDPVSFLWDFDQANSGVAPSTLEDPGWVTFDSIGSYTVTLTTTDLQGLPDPSPATLSLTVEEQSVVPEPTVAHWSFDEAMGLIAGDSTGNDNYGVLGSPDWVLDTPDDSPSALLFDGVADRVSAPAIDIAGEELSIVLWFKVACHPSSSRDGRLLSKADGSGTQAHYWMLSTTADGSDTRLRLRLKTAGTTSTLIAPTSDVVIGEWTHVAAVYDGATMRLYQNGLEVGSAIKTGMLDVDPTIAVAIGNQPVAAGSAPFCGAIDDVMIYDRALDAQEVGTLYLTNPAYLVPLLDGSMRSLAILLLVCIGGYQATRAGPTAGRATG